MDHNGDNLPANIFYNDDKQEYRISIRREGVIQDINLGELIDLDEQFKYAKYFLNEISKLSLEDTSIMNMKYTDLKGYIKKHNLPIMTINSDRKRVGWIIIMLRLLKYQNLETKQEIIDEYNQLKEWRDAPGFPEGWKQMWGAYNIKFNCGWKNVGHWTFKRPDNIIFNHEKIAINYIDIPLPDFNEIVNGLPEELQWKTFKTNMNKYKWNNTKGWEPYISKAWESYINLYIDCGPQKYKGIRYCKTFKKWEISIRHNGKTYNCGCYYSQDKAKEKLDEEMIRIIGYIPINKGHMYIDKTKTNKYKFRKNNKSKTFNTMTEALCYKFLILLKIRSNIIQNF